MPRLAAFRPGVVVAGVDFGSVPAYQLLFGAAMWDQTACFALQYAYPPSPLALMRPDGLLQPLGEFARVTLMRIPVNFASGVEELNKVCKATNESDTVEIALARTAEAFSLFNNNPRIKKAEVESASKDACDLVNAAWDMRLWIENGFTEKREWRTTGGVVIGYP